MKTFVLFLLLSLFVITCYAEESGFISTEQTDTTLKALNQLPDGLSHEAFETLISKRFSTTHRFYVDLNTVNKNSIYTYYQHNQDFMKIRNKILELYFGLS